LDLHFLSLGGGEIALGWWFEECLVPYLTDTDRLSNVKSISIVTGYGKTRTRGRRHGDDGMRKRCRAMLRFMDIAELEQPNLGRIHIDKESLIELVKKNSGRIIFDLNGYLSWKEAETTANAIPDTVQKIRARFKPTVPGSGGPPFTRVESEFTSDEYRLENQRERLSRLREQDTLNDDEYHADIDYAVRDGIKFEQGMDESANRSRGNYHERDLRRVDSDRFGINGPQGHDVRANRVDSRGWVDGESSIYGESSIHERGGLSRDQVRGADQSLYSKGSQFRVVPDSYREREGDLNRDNPPISRFHEAGLSRAGVNNQKFEGFVDSNRNEIRHVDQSQGFDHRGETGRIRVDDRGQDDLGYRNHSSVRINGRGGDREFHSDQPRYPVLVSQPRQFTDEYADRAGPSNDFGAGELGYGYQRARYLNEAQQIGVGRTGRDVMPAGHEFRRDNRNDAFEQEWRNGPDTELPRFSSGPREAWRSTEHSITNNSIYDPLSERQDVVRHGPSSQSRGYREDVTMFKDHDLPNAANHMGGHSSPYSSRDNYRINDRIAEYREHDSRVFTQDNERKRSYDEGSSQHKQGDLTMYQEPQGNAVAIEHRISSSSRGYALEPQPQRRRLS
jgi:hypothetical protein